MSTRRQHRLQAVIEAIPQDGNSVTVYQLCERLARFRDPGVELRTFSTQIRRDVYYLQALYPALLIEGGTGSTLNIAWPARQRPLERYALSTAQIIAFATLKKFGVNVMPQHMAEVLAPFMHAAEVEMASQIAEDKPNVTPLKAKNAAANWLSKIIYLPERIAFIAPSVDPEIERTVHGALMEEKPLSILYRESNKRWIVSPLGIAQQGVRTYLIVQPHGDDSSPRTLLLARIRSAKEVNEAFRKPLRFNLNKFLQKSIAGPRHDYFVQDAYGEPITLKLWVHSGTQWLKETPLSEDQSVEPCDPTDLQGDYLLTCTVPLSESLVWWLLSISQYVRVLEPSNLRQRVMHDLRASLAGYEV